VVQVLILLVLDLGVGRFEGLGFPTRQLFGLFSPIRGCLEGLM
jgi:hypothetical protein